ncbi:MAG TPA: MOSC N-terminal beta barrel domain-containing protein [Streptosporangiaceae bacterium]
MSGPAGSPRLASIHIYPLKAGRAVDLAESVVEPWGLAGDRRWLVVDSDGRFVSQREEPALARVIAAYPAAGTDRARDPGPASTLTLSADGNPPLAVRVPSAGDPAEMVPVAVWRSEICAAAAGKEADEWLSDFLGRTVRLVYLDDPTRRKVDQDYGAPDDPVSFADGYPVLLTSTGSLEELGRWLTDDGHPPVPMNRFRPNVVVAGAPPWSEDGWRRIRIGSITFRVVKPCGRCQVTTIDQATAQRGRQPLTMLGRRRRFGQQLVFGQNMIPHARGSIRVGDAVQVLERSGP